MDATTKTWSLLNLVLILVTLGFAAMSTSTVFAVPAWLPPMFFIMAGIVVACLIIHLIASWSSEKKHKKRRKAIAEKLAEFYLSGEDVVARIKADDFNGDVVLLARKWSDSVIKYFMSNPDDLGVTRLLLLRPRQADWFVFNQFNPLGKDRQTVDIYAFRHISIEMEKLLDLVGEFSR